jgi:signal transduction histidine kinase
MRKRLTTIVSLISVLILVVIQVYILYSYYEVKSENFDMVYSKEILKTIENKNDDFYSDSLDVKFNELAFSSLQNKDNLANQSFQNGILSSFNGLLKTFDLNSERIKEYTHENNLDTSFLARYMIDEISFLDLNKKTLVYKRKFKENSNQKPKGLYIKSYYKEGNYYVLKYAYYIDFTNKWKIILKEVYGLLVMILLTIFIVTFGFIYTLRTLGRQKKLSGLKDDFIDNITHEFKTPLSIISLGVSSLKKDLIRNDDQKFNETCQLIEKQNHNLSKMIDQVIDVDMLDNNSYSTNKKAVVLKNFMHEMIQSFHENELSGKKTQIVEEYLLGDDFKYILDPVQFTRAIHNLFCNSIKYCKKEPAVRIRIWLDNQLKIEISDNGIGIKEEHVERIFNKFYRADNPAKIKGLGLGLYIVKRIIENHKGTINLQSIPGEGTMVSIHLPV